MSLRAALMVLACMPLFGCITTGPAHDHASWSTDTLMVVLDDPRSTRSRHPQLGPGYTARLSYESDPVLHRRATEIAKDHGVEILTQWPLRNVAVHCFLIEKPTPSVVQALERDHRVKWVQPFNAFTVRQDAARLTADHNAYQRLAANLPNRGEGVKVAVVDTSVDRSHRDLRNSRIRQQDFVGRPKHVDGESHGTAVVGLIAARPDSPRGVRGIASNARVDVLRACWEVQEGGRCNTLTLALALDAAIDLQPDVLNLSLTGAYDRVLQTLIDRLTAEGTVVVAAFDESRTPATRFPAPTAGVIYAFGYDDETAPLPEHRHAAYSVMSAPREAFTLAPMDGYDIASGHSIAAPQIAAALACLIDEYPDAERDTLHEMLVSKLSARP